MNILSKFSSFRTILSPRCDEVSLQLTQTPLARMPLQRSFFIGLHLKLCRACRAYGRNLVFLDRAFSAYPTHVEEVTAQRLSDEARERIRVELKKIG